MFFKTENKTYSIVFCSRETSDLLESICNPVELKVNCKLTNDELAYMFAFHREVSRLFGNEHASVDNLLVSESIEEKVLIDNVKSLIDSLDSSILMERIKDCENFFIKNSDNNTIVIMFDDTDLDPSPSYVKLEAKRPCKAVLEGLYKTVGYFEIHNGFVQVPSKDTLTIAEVYKTMAVHSEGIRKDD